MRLKILTFHVEILAACSHAAILDVLCLLYPSPPRPLIPASPLHILVAIRKLVASSRCFPGFRSHSPRATPLIYAHIPHTHTQCILGFAFAAAQRDWVEAVLVNEPVIYIEGGRHPLCELCVDTFVSAYSRTNNYIQMERQMHRHKQSFVPAEIDSLF